MNSNFLEPFTRKSIATSNRPNKQVTQIYQKTTEDLKVFFGTELNLPEKAARLHVNFQGTKGLLQDLQSEANTGIMGDERDLYRRKSFFGENQKPKPSLPPFFDSVKEAMDDRIIQCVAGLAVLSLVTGMIQDWRTGWTEGISILLALCLLILITSWNDWMKDTQFVRLANRALDEDITVIRGKLGAMQQINMWELVVGDVVMLHAGDKVPADCIVIDSTNLLVEQKGQRDRLKKDAKTDPFLYADSFIVNGNVRAVVVVVGLQSSRDQELELKLDQKTPLQKKLFVLSQTFTYIGLWAALIIFIVSTVILSIQTGVDDQVGGVIFSKKLVQNVILCFIIILVAIPEGLPMTVGISLAYSIHNMFLKDKILVRKLESNETMGEVTEFILGKTGTLTTEDMSIVKFYVQDFVGSNTRKDSLVHCNISHHVLDLIKESIIYNNQCHIEMNENAFYVPVGNGTEVSLLKWLQGAEIPVHTMIKLKETPIMKAHLEFSSDQKMSIVAIEHEGEHGHKFVRVYVKGAPEEVINRCSHKFHINGERVELSQADQDYMTNDLMAKNFCKQLGLRCLAFSYADYSLEDFEAIQKETGNFSSDSSFTRLQTGAHQTFLIMVAMKDPLRDGVKKAIELAKNEGKVEVRLVSADHLDTALAYAADAGIINKQILDENFGFERASQYAMNASEFEAAVGIKYVADEENNRLIPKPNNQQKFEQLMDTLVVLGRAKPLHKQLIATGLQEMGRKVAVIGEGITDLPAFESADVSFAMGSGCSLARNRASMVLINDDFQSCIRALLRGRNIYSNIKRFLQFQITVNFSILVCILIGLCYLTESPFNAVMLIWINLIMDVLAALALATAPPLARVISEKAITQDVPILQPEIWRQIYGVTIWNVIVITLVILFGASAFGLEYTNADQANESVAKRQHFTIIFNTFVFLQFFNQINCRVVGPKDLNVFTNFFNNWIFIFVLAVIFFIQWSASHTGGLSLTWMFQTAEIDHQVFWTTVFWGATALVVSAMLKLSPKEWLEKVPVKIDEKNALGANSKLVTFYGKAANKSQVKQNNTNDDDFAPAANSEI